MDMWKSEAYNHFKLPPVILPVGKDGKVQYRFFCKRYVRWTAM